MTEKVFGDTETRIVCNTVMNTDDMQAVIEACFEVAQRGGTLEGEKPIIVNSAMESSHKSQIVIMAPGEAAVKELLDDIRETCARYQIDPVVKKPMLRDVTVVIKHTPLGSQDGPHGDFDDSGGPEPS